MYIIETDQEKIVVEKVTSEKDLKVVMGDSLKLKNIF